MRPGDMQHGEPNRGRYDMAADRARGCAGFATSDPTTSTIDVANGMIGGSRRSPPAASPAPSGHP